MVGGREDLLTMWMAHYLAELMSVAEQSGNDLAGTAAKREASELIFRLWEHRAELAGKANPMKNYENAVDQLISMNSGGYFHFESSPRHNLPIIEFRKSSNRLFTSIFLLNTPETGDTDNVAKKYLSKVEQELLSKLADAKGRRFTVRFVSDDNEDANAARKKQIRAEIESVRAALNSLEAEIDEYVK